MSTYKVETAPWLDKMLALAVIALPASIALLPAPKVNLESVALTVFAALAGLVGLFVLRSGWLVNVFMMKRTVLCVVAASAAIGAVFGTQAWLPSALAWALISAGAWLALLLTLIVCRAVAWIVLWPVVQLARLLSFESAPAQCGSYASPSPRRYTATAPRYTAPAGAGYAAAAGAATGYAAWDMLDPLNAANPLNQMHEAPSPFPTDNTNGMPMIPGMLVDAIGHTYGDPAPIFEPAPIYDYTPACDYSSSNCGGSNTGGGFDF